MSEETPPVVSRAKSHPAMLRAIARARGADRRALRRADARGHREVAGGRSGPGGVASDRGAEAGDAADMRIAVFSAWLAGKRQLAGTAPAVGASARDAQRARAARRTSCVGRRAACWARGTSS